MFRHASVLILAAFLLTPAYGDDDIFGDDEASTVKGDILESRGDLAKGLGKGSFLRSLSVKEFQKAIDLLLDNRRESIKNYYDIQELREEELEEDRATASEIRQLSSSLAPDRLNENQLNAKTGDLYWPAPLNDDALAPYRKPIEESFRKRFAKDEIYREFDYLKIHRMVKRIREALATIEDKMDAAEVVALKTYLKQIDYEGRFNRAGDRVDY